MLSEISFFTISYEHIFTPIPRNIQIEGGSTTKRNKCFFSQGKPCRIPQFPQNIWMEVAQPPATIAAGSNPKGLNQISTCDLSIGNVPWVDGNMPWVEGSTNGANPWSYLLWRVRCIVHANTNIIDRGLSQLWRSLINLWSPFMCVSPFGICNEVLFQQSCFSIFCTLLHKCDIEKVVKWYFKPFMGTDFLFTYMSNIGILSSLFHVIYARISCTCNMSYSIYRVRSWHI